MCLSESVQNPLNWSFKRTRCSYLFCFVAMCWLMLVQILTRLVWHKDLLSFTPSASYFFFFFVGLQLTKPRSNLKRTLKETLVQSETENIRPLVVPFYVKAEVHSFLTASFLQKIHYNRFFTGMIDLQIWKGFLERSNLPKQCGQLYQRIMES